MTLASSAVWMTGLTKPPLIDLRSYEVITTLKLAKLRSLIVISKAKRTLPLSDCKKTDVPMLIDEMDVAEFVLTG